MPISMPYLRYYSPSRLPGTNSRAPYTSASAMNLQRTTMPKALPKIGSLNTAPATTPQAPSFGRDLVELFSQVQNIFKQVSTFNSAVQEQFKLDQQNGVGLLQGADMFSLSVKDALDVLQTQLPRLQLSTNERFLATGQLSPFDQVGLLAQQYLVGEIKKEALDFALTEFGINPEELSLGNIAEMGYEYLLDQLGFGSAASEAASAGAGAVAEKALEDGAEAAAESGLGIGSAAGQIAGAIGAAYSIYGLIDNFGQSTPVVGALQGATAGAYIGSIIPGVGTLIGGAVGGIVGAITGLFHSGKHKNQIARDQVRNFMQQAGILDQNWSIELADGSRYDIGLDGGHRDLNLDGTERRRFETDGSNPLTPEAIGLVNPLAVILTGGEKEKGTSVAFAGYFTNAILSNATDLEAARINALKIFEKFQMTPDQAVQTLDNLRQAGRINEQEFMAYVNGLNTLFNGVPPSLAQ